MRCYCKWFAPVDHCVLHQSDITMSTMASQITGIWTVCSAVCSGVHQIKHQSSAPLAFVRGTYRCPLDSIHNGPEYVSIWWRHHAITSTSALRQLSLSTTRPLVQSVSNLTAMKPSTLPQPCWESTQHKLSLMRTICSCYHVIVLHRHSLSLLCVTLTTKTLPRDDAIGWKRLPCYWPFMRGIQRSPVDSPYKGSLTLALVPSLILAYWKG